MKTKNIFWKVFLGIFLSFVIFNNKIFAKENLENNKISSIELHCNSGIAMDFNTGNILYNNNCTKKIFPASTTKILTCIVALENLELDDTTVISKKVIQNTPLDSSVMGIKAGELYTIEELLYGLMLPSGNDAALAIAEAVSGSTSKFVELMNQKAIEIGCNESNFVNPHGYHDDNHYSTAYDMAMIFRYCLQNDSFKEIISTKEITIKAANSGNELKLVNSNRMLNENYTKTYYEYMKGGKTGYTLEARGTFIGYGIKNDNIVIAAAFDGSQNINGLQGRFLDTKTLLNYSFDNYSKKIIIDSNDYIFNIYDEKNRKHYVLKLENDVYGLTNEIPNIEYSLNIDQNKIDDILEKNNEIYLNKIVGTIDFKYNFKNNIILTSNISNTQNLIIIDVLNYIPKSTIYNIIFISTLSIFLLISFLFILLYIKKTFTKKSCNIQIIN